MLLPVGDTPNPRMTPYVTWGLMLVNIAIYLLVTLPLGAARPDPADPLLYEYFQAFGRGVFSLSEIARSVSAYDLTVFRYGFRPADPSLLALLTAMFLHGGFLHLAGNMLFLWIFGDNVEHRLGPVRFLFAYLGTGVAATLVFALFALDSPYPMIGASGAISGVLGCYFLWFPRNQVRTFIFLFPIFMQTVLIPARWVLGFYLLVDNLLPFLLNGGRSATGVAHGAHIGGFLAGLALAWGVSQFPHLRARGASRPAGREVDGRRPAAESFTAPLQAGDLDAALAGYARLDRGGRQAIPAGLVIDLGEQLLARGDSFVALSLFRRFIAERPADPEIGRAFLGAGQALLDQPRGSTSAYHYFLSALDATRDPWVAEQARRYIEQIQHRQGKG